jgi:circadian clock protein KaiB
MSDIRRIPSHGTAIALQQRAQAVFTASVFRSGRNNMNKHEDSPGYNLRLYIAGQTPRSIAAVSNLLKLCETYLSGRYRLDVIDLMAEPNRAQRDRIVAVPTLVRRWPGAVARIIGDLSNSERVLNRLKINVRAKAQR